MPTQPIPIPCEYFELFGVQCAVGSVMSYPGAWRGYIQWTSKEEALSDAHGPLPTGCGEWNWCRDDWVGFDTARLSGEYIDWDCLLRLMEKIILQHVPVLTLHGWRYAREYQGYTTLGLRDASGSWAGLITANPRKKYLEVFSMKKRVGDKVASKALRTNSDKEIAAFLLERGVPKPDQRLLDLLITPPPIIQALTQEIPGGAFLYRKK